MRCWAWVVLLLTTAAVTRSIHAAPVCPLLDQDTGCCGSQCRVGLCSALYSFGLALVSIVKPKPQGAQRCSMPNGPTETAGLQMKGTDQHFRQPPVAAHSQRVCACSSNQESCSGPVHEAATATKQQAGVTMPIMAHQQVSTVACRVRLSIRCAVVGQRSRAMQSATVLGTDPHLQLQRHCAGQAACVQGFTTALQLLTHSKCAGRQFCHDNTPCTTCACLLWHTAPL